MSRFRAALRHRQRGIALVLVLWVLILLGLIAASFLRETRLGTNLARNIAENARAEALADAGIQRAMLGLLDRDPATRWRADGTAYSLVLDDGMVVIRIEDENGKIDLNRAPARLLLGLFESAGADPETARNVADAISDFRDPDHERRPAGAEDTDYLAAGLAEGAKDAPFDDKDELMQVLGMRREIYDSIRPYITVHSGRGRVNLFTASEFVLRAIPNLTPEQLERIRADKVSGVRLQRAQPDTVTVRAEATTRGGGAFIREAVMRRTGDSERPFSILDWRHAWRSALEPAAELAPQ
jgi:general secretion pathway protein K